MRWKKCHKTGPNRCILNSRKGTQRKMDKLPFTAWSVSLVFLMRSCQIANIRRKPASDTVFKRVNCRAGEDLCYSHLPVMVWVAVSGRRNSKQHRQDSGTYLEESMMVLREKKRAYWAVSRVNALRNLSRKKSRKSSCHFRADFWVGFGSAVYNNGSWT